MLNFTGYECRDIAYIYPGSHVFRLQLEELGGNHSCRGLGSLILCWQQDIPRCEAAAEETLARDAGCSEELLLQPRKPPGSEVYDDQREDPVFNFLCDLEDEQDFIALEILGILAHLVPLVILWILLLNSSEG